MPDFPTVLITFARPEESRVFRRRLASRRRVQEESIDFEVGTLGETTVAVLHTGIGPEAAEASMNKALQIGHWTCVIAAGFAGGLDPQLPIGEILVEHRPPAEPARLVSRPLPVETVAEKARVFAETRARAVDMETDTIAAACRTARVAMIAVRAISDPATDALPVPFGAWFDLKRQQPRPLALLGYLCRHPGRVPAFIRFLRTLNPVAEVLAAAIERVVEKEYRSR